VHAISNEVVAVSPVLPHLGTQKFSFEVATVDPGSGTVADPTGTCKSAKNTSFDCMVIRYAIQNAGDRPVRYMRMSCSDSIFTPEYKDAKGEWERVPMYKMWACGRNIRITNVILPGETVRGEVMLSRLGFYDFSKLKVPGDYKFRFIFWPLSCFASPDGRFCITKAEFQQPMPSSEISLSAR
jgi:hypothetical protein